jgi:predicted YcjX-like family ATPase
MCRGVTGGSRVREKMKASYSVGKEQIMAMDVRSESRSERVKDVECKFLTSCMAFSMQAVREGRIFPVDVFEGPMLSFYPSLS